MDKFEKVITQDEDIRKFLELFQDYNLKFIEESTKIFKDSINPNRVNLSIQKSNISKEQMRNLALTMGPNNNGHDKRVDAMLLQYFDNADTVGFGIEKSDTAINYRIYFEHSIDKDKRKELVGMGVKEKQTGFSLKWTDRVHEYDNYFNQTSFENEDALTSLQKRAGVDFIPQICMNIFDIDESDPNRIRNAYYTETSGLRKKKAVYTQLDNTYGRDITDDIFDFSSVDLREHFAAFNDARLGMVAFGNSDDKEYITLYFFHVPARKP